MPARQIGLIANDGKPGAPELVRQLMDAFASHRLPVRLEARTAELICEESTATHEDLAQTCDLLAVLGGDGTILQVLHALKERSRPILGINLGTLGFLTCVGAAAWPQAVEAIVHGTYQLSERTLLRAEIVRDGATIATHSALNDAVISRGEQSQLIRLDVSVDGATLSEYTADGLIVSTPTGSTAYSLSAGGPVLAPDSGVFVVTPICPHVLTMRPVLVSDASHIAIAPARGGGTAFLTLDGQPSRRLEPGDRLHLTKAPGKLPLAMLPGVSFFEVLRQKLKWSGSAV
jgi:NAD+ kinase